MRLRLNSCHTASDEISHSPRRETVQVGRFKSMGHAEKRRFQKAGKRRQKFDHKRKFKEKQKYSNIIETEVEQLKAQYEEVSILMGDNRGFM